MHWHFPVDVEPVVAQPRRPPDPRLILRLLRSRLRVHFRSAIRRALRDLRGLLFIVLADNLACLRARSWLGRVQTLVVRLALQGLRSVDVQQQLEDLPQCIQNLQRFVEEEEMQYLAVRALHQLERENRREQAPPGDWPMRGEHQEAPEPTFDWAELAVVLAALLQHSFLRSFDAFRPLMQRLTEETQAALHERFGEEYQEALQRPTFTQHRPGIRQWYTMLLRHNEQPIDNGLEQLLQEFDHDGWRPNAELQDARIAAFTTRIERKQRKAAVTRELTAVRAALGRDSSSLVLQRTKEELLREFSAIKASDALLEYRTVRCRLRPTRQQAAELKKRMAAARFTYNKCVEYSRKTRKGSKAKMTALFVSDPLRRAPGRAALVYPDGMGPSPGWVLDTPSDIRNSAVDQFCAARTAAFTNRARNNIKHFYMRFKSRKQNKFFAITVSAREVHLHDARHQLRQRWHQAEPPAPGVKVHNVRKFISFSGMPNITITAPSDLQVEGAVKIIHRHGYWYALLPHVVEPQPVQPPKRCVACDPGLKAFLTLMDLMGNFTHIGRANWEKLRALKTRQRRAQSKMTKFTNIKKRRHHKHNWWDWQRFVKARREFDCTSAKIANWISDLHFQSAAFLCKQGDIILLPKFSTSTMIKESAAWTHEFNDRLNTLRHYQFRRHLLDKCRLLGKTLVLCSEMYTSRTCGRCCRLHASLRGSDDVFQCPNCDFQAGRDENAAFNIMRFVWAGSLSVFELNGVRQ